MRKYLSPCALIMLLLVAGTAKAIDRDSAAAASVIALQAQAAANEAGSDAQAAMNAALDNIYGPEGALSIRPAVDVMSELTAGDEDIVVAYDWFYGTNLSGGGPYCNGAVDAFNTFVQKIDAANEELIATIAAWGVLEDRDDDWFQTDPTPAEWLEIVNRFDDVAKLYTDVPDGVINWANSAENIANSSFNKSTEAEDHYEAGDADMEAGNTAQWPIPDQPQP